MARDRHNGDHNGHGAHVTETPDVSHIKNVDVTHEASDVSVSALLKFVLALTVMTGLVAVLMLGLFKFFESQAEKEPQPGPMAMTGEERLPPEPRLQGARGFQVKLEDGQGVNLELREPEAEYRVLREQWERQLNCKSPEVSSQESHAPVAESHAPATDSHATATESHATATQSKPVPCVPIEEAIQKLVRDQLVRSRAKDGALEGTGVRSLDYGIDIPTAASSGRMTMKQ